MHPDENNRAKKRKITVPKGKGFGTANVSPIRRSNNQNSEGRRA
jgi:hypothetical protein